MERASGKDLSLGLDLIEAERREAERWIRKAVGKDSPFVFSFPASCIDSIFRYLPFFSFSLRIHSFSACLMMLEKLRPV